jgi:glycyl-tRNA synthetase beta chain
MLRMGYTFDLVEAILSVDFDLIPMIRPKLDQLKIFTQEEVGFESLVLTNKRIGNILKNQEEVTGVNRDLFQHACESRLWHAFEELKDEIQSNVGTGQYTDALRLMMRLRKPVDDFFDSVEVLTKDHPDLKKNRIGVLRNLSQLFLSMADFSKFSI